MANEVDVITSLSNTIAEKQVELADLETKLSDAVQHCEGLKSYVAKLQEEKASAQAVIKFSSDLRVSLGYVDESAQQEEAPAVEGEVVPTQEEPNVEPQAQEAEVASEPNAEAVY